MKLGEMRAEITLGGKSYCTDYIVTEEDMGFDADEAQELLGDANARVSVSLGASDKDYGAGFSMQVSVTLSCNQDAETIRAANGMCLALAEEFGPEAFEVARAMYERVTS